MMSKERHLKGEKSDFFCLSCHPFWRVACLLYVKFHELIVNRRDNDKVDRHT